MYLRGLKTWASSPQTSETLGVHYNLHKRSDTGINLPIIPTNRGDDTLTLADWDFGH